MRQVAKEIPIFKRLLGKKTKIEDVMLIQHPSIVLNPLHAKFYSTMPCTPFCRPLFWHYIIAKSVLVRHMFFM